jgi:hypothetical protein
MGQFASSSHQHGFSRSRLCSVKEPKLDGMEMGASGTEEPVASQRLSSSFQLMRVRNLPQWANKGCVGIGDVIQVRQVDTRIALDFVQLQFSLFLCIFLQSSHPEETNKLTWFFVSFLGSPLFLF